VVGYIGDGINDAPALHSAELGISVDRAADVAKEADVGTRLKVRLIHVDVDKGFIDFEKML
jgi:P-type Mg2+ transporter